MGNNLRYSQDFSTLYPRLFSRLQDLSGDFTVAGQTYRSVFEIAAGLKEALGSPAGEDDALCVYTDDKALIAAALIASLAGGPTLLLPHGLNGQILQEMRESHHFRRVLTDMPGDFPEDVEIIRPQKRPHIESVITPSRDPDRPFVKLFTGGSTAKPRLWSKTPRNLLAEVIYLSRKFAITEEDVFIATVPPQHIYGLLFSVLLPLVSSCRVLKGIYTYPQEILSYIAKLDATVLVSIPVYYRVLKGDNLQRYSLRLAFSSAGMLDEADARHFLAGTGLGIHEIYGSTETGGVATRCRGANEKTWTPFDHMGWKIAEDRLHVRSDFISPELPRDNDGFFMTGDLAEYDGKEHFILHGRADGIVKVGGKRVDLQEVQNRFLALPEVEDAVVIALPVDRGRENEIVAVVAGRLDENRLRRLLSSQLETCAVPRRIRVVDKIPFLITGKYDRGAIERLFQERDE